MTPRSTPDANPREMRTVSTPRVKQIEVATRRAEAIRLRTAGVPWEEIKDKLGYASKGAACTDVTRALEVARSELGESVEAMKQLELERLDAVHRVAMDVMGRDHVTVSNGRVMRDDDGVPLLDDGPKLAAGDRVVRVSESRRKLLGMNEPERTEVAAAVSFQYKFDGAEDV